MPGLPIGNDPTAFWASFYAGLYSGVLYSALTGFFVGVAVWLVQRWSDDRRLTNGYRRELDVLRQRLRTIVQLDADVVNYTTAANAAPMLVQNVCRELEGCPLGVWHKALKKQDRALIEALTELQLKAAELRVIGTRLDVRLNNLVRRHNAAQNVIAVNDQADEIFYRGRRLYQIPVEPLLAAADMPAAAVPRFEASYSSLTEDTELDTLAESFIRNRDSMLKAVVAVRLCLAGESCGLG